MDSAIAPAYPPQAPAHVHSWLDAPSSPLTPYARDDVLRAKKKLIPWDQKKAIFGMSKRPVRHGDLLASLDFGFWTGLLHKNYFFQSNKDPRLWPQLLPAVFPHAREAWDAKFLGKASRDLNEVRKFRNRIFHHEPIWRRTLANDRLLILELISWSSPEMAALAASTDRVSEVLSDAFRRRLRIRVYRESRR